MKVIACLIPALMLSAFILSSKSFALELDPEEIRSNEKDQPVRVLQSRFFKKAMRPEFGVLLGTVRDEAYLNTMTHGLKFSMFVTEWIGAELQYISTTVDDSDDRKALNKLVYRPLDAESDDEYVSPDPEVNPLHRMIDINAVIAPFYGKLNLMDLTTVYLDLYLAGGISSVNTDQGDKTAFNFAIGQRFYFSNSISFRIDFRNRIFTEKRSGKDTTREAVTMDFGLSYFFL